MEKQGEMIVLTEKITQFRIVVGRFGEMDRAKWWNTRGMLSSLGAMAVSRGCPKTHFFSRFRAVAAVANQRCEEVFDPPDAFTLWRLTPEIEDRIEEDWSRWLEAPDPWHEFLEKVNGVGDLGLVESLQTLGLIDEGLAAKVKKLRRADDSRSVPLPEANELDEDTVALLAAGFSRGEPEKPAIPYVRVEGMRV